MATLGTTRVPFTAVMPDGKLKVMTVDRPHNIAAKAGRFLIFGGEFGARLQPRGRVELIAAWKNQADDRAPIAEMTTTNGPEMMDAIDRLVAAADAYLEKHTVK